MQAQLIRQNVSKSVSSPITDEILLMAKSEAGLLALIGIEFEAGNPESFKKKSAGALQVSERHFGDMLHGKANVTPRQLHIISTACKSALFMRWSILHFFGGYNGFPETGNS